MPLFDGWSARAEPVAHGPGPWNSLKLANRPIQHGHAVDARVGVEPNRSPFLAAEYNKPGISRRARVAVLDGIARIPRLQPPKSTPIGKQGGSCAT
jgi:hypothetical protein